MVRLSDAPPTPAVCAGVGGLPPCIGGWRRGSLAGRFRAEPGVIDGAFLFLSCFGKVTLVRPLISDLTLFAEVPGRV